MTYQELNPEIAPELSEKEIINYYRNFEAGFENLLDEEIMTQYHMIINDMGEEAGFHQDDIRDFNAIS